MRRFEFDDPGISLGAAIRTIEAALEDEGLELLPGGAKAQVIRSAIVDGRAVVTVPAGRIGRIPARTA
jgi:hypothetical protein